MNEDEIYNEAWRLWGEELQMDILIEEMAELTQAIIKTRRNGLTFSRAVFEEIADVSICMEQVACRLKQMPTSDGSTWYDMTVEVKRQKLARLEERIAAAKAEANDERD